MRTRKIKKRFILLCALTVLLALIIWTAWGNTALMVNTIPVSSDRIPAGFSGYRIAQVSDLHNAEFGDGNEKLLGMLSDSEPDLIVITGDLVDSRRTDMDVALHFAGEAVKIAPTYYVSGNHESRITNYGELREALMSAGVTVLEDEAATLEQNGETVTLIGLSDPNFAIGSDALEEPSAMVSTKLNGLLESENGYTILLSHRPELFETYVSCGVDLVFSGHAHGGQFRLPLIGGLVAPNQGLFPKYDAGLYTDANTNMVVSRGIGNSIIPFRFNNRPEVVLVELRSES